MRVLTGSALILACAPALIAQDSSRTTAVATPVAAAPVSRDSLQRLVDDRLNAGRTAGLIIGVLHPDGSRFVAGAGSERTGRPLDEQTMFEIGSITKAFTGILLAEMVNRGEVRLDQPVAELLPSTVRVPARNGRRITLAHLAAQVSGLPRLPSNLRPADPANPYADYSVAQLYEFLSQHELRRDPGAQYEYSNLGVGLLGHALARRAGMSYEALLRQRVLAPLGMTRTGIALSAELRDRMSEGHDGAGSVVPPWDIPTLAGAGALRSSLEDMMKFAAALLSPPDNSVGRAIILSLTPRFQANQVLSLGLNWHRVVFEGDTLIFHNGGTAGFRTFVGVTARERMGIVLLGNSAQDNEDIARHVLQPRLPVPKVLARAEVALPQEVLAEYVGSYPLTPQFALTVTMEGDALFVQGTGQPRFPVFAEAKDRFFLKVFEAQLHFIRNPDGAVTGVALLQNGGRQEASKVRLP